MNGIIHNCTHKDTADPIFRLSEDEMFIRIFNYIEHLYSKIKPKQLFFMAVDGVAPRAKMNQQRARRFRTALDAEKAREKAIASGQELPKEEPFDSNCITPGTEFMAKLSEQLKYFVHKKVTEDSDWQGVEIVLSGHEVPGEGEHKIMEYIRNSKAQPQYDANVRHCLYGLDADLIMLGLLSHDPHFCLLREEVTFGRQSKTQSKELEHQNFYLLHLCMVREYLESEFQELKAPGAMGFPFDMEKVIDDFILMAFFVGNDFLPNLPGLHINESALAEMFGFYKEVLPTCDGYVNEGGVINVQRLGKLLSKLEDVDYKNFDKEMENKNWMISKRQVDETAQQEMQGKHLTITPGQKKLWDEKIFPYIRNRERSRQPLDLGCDLNAADRKFVQSLADRFHIQWSTKADDDGQRHLLVQIPETAGESDDEDEEVQISINRIAKLYQKASVAEVTPEEAQDQYLAIYNEKFLEWKREYYADKLQWSSENMEDEVRKMCENYVEGLQWVLYYYYRGIQSWPWFYQYHYSPKITDVAKGMGAGMNFEMGQPFRPFEQLMGVLPDRSKNILPQAYWDLMTDEKSPIKDFYPREFSLDMNGKKMDWEAVVLIPFIEEKRLLDAMEMKNHLLTDEERGRNKIGYAIRFVYDPKAHFTYPSSRVEVFPNIVGCRCVMNHFEMPSTEGLAYRVGLMDGAKLNVEALAGFPSLAILPYSSAIGFHGVNVFGQESRNQSVIITLSDAHMRAKIEYAKEKLGKKCFVGYPFLQEVKIAKVSDELFYYVFKNGQVVQKHNSPREIEYFNKKSKAIENHYGKRFGVIIDTVEALVHVEHLKGLKQMHDGAHMKEYGLIPGQEADWPPQLLVDEVINEDERFLERNSLRLEEEFPIDSNGFFLGDYNYGGPAQVVGYDGNSLKISIKIVRSKEPEFTRPVIAKAERENKYVPSHQLAGRLALHPMILSKITACFFVHTVGGLKVNLGLNLKFESKKQKVLGYTRKTASGWEYSLAAAQLISQYMSTFPDFFIALSCLGAVLTSGASSELKDIDLFPDKKQAQKRIKEIGGWLKSVETSKFERVPLDAEQLDSEVVMALASAADTYKSPPSGTNILKGVPRSAMVKPSDAAHRLGNQRFALGDRVTYVQDSGKVGIGMRGTVVGISRTATTKLLDVVFDDAFMSGSSLGQRCPPFRGMNVPAQSVLNTTDRQVVTGSRASQRHSYGLNPMTGRRGGMNGMQRYREAAPTAPLPGSFSSVLNGSRYDGQHADPAARQHAEMVHRPAPNHAQGRGQSYRNRSRGRGRGLSRSGRAHVLPVRHQQGVAPQPQKSYNAVPPPASLTGYYNGGRGRGDRKHPSRGAPQGDQGTASTPAA